MKPGVRSRAIVAEPLPQYQTRPPLVVDCSIVCAVLFDEPERDEALRCVQGRDLFAPHLLDYEVVSVALKKSRGGWPPDSVALALADYGDLALELRTPHLPRQHDLAQRYSLSAYDAAYLWLAEHLKAPLATFDRRLGQAAREHLTQLS